MTANDTSAMALILQGVGKEYRLYDSPRARLKALLTGRALHRSHWALHDVSLQLPRGQCLGVVGSNGAGKSTLLKLITGTLQPSTGSVQRHGRITAILELGAGFHPEFTGRQNLYFGASLIGISADEMARLEPDVLAFAEIGAAIDRPVKTYSSGMVVRLAFALVTAVQPDLLIIDEALAVGDQYFQRKCIERIAAFRQAGCSILFCSHSMYHIRHLCDQVLWLHQGRVMALDDTEPAVTAYESHSRAQAQPDPSTPTGANTPSPDTAATATAPAEFVSFQPEGLSQDDIPLLLSPHLSIRMSARVPGTEPPSFGVMLEQLQGAGITSVAMHVDQALPERRSDGLWHARLTFPDIPLGSGDYMLSAYLFDAAGLVVYEERLHCQPFRVHYPHELPGLVRLPHHWD